MDVKQLQETSRQLSKAFDGGDPSTTLLTLLAPLEKWKASEDLLRQSKIGIAVSKLRSSKDSKVALLASHLINKWKADVKTKKPGVTGGGTPGKNGLNGDLRSQTNSPAPKKEVLAPPPAPKKFSVAPEKRNAKEDGVDTALTGNPTRDGSITLIYNGLAFMSEEAPADILAVSKSVEAAAFELYQPETSTTYKQKMRSLHLNLKMKQNAELRKDVFSRAIEPKRFVSMSSEELKSEEMRKKEKEIAKENMNKSMTPSQDKSISTTYVSRSRCREEYREDLMLRCSRGQWSVRSSLRPAHRSPSPTSNLC